MDRGPHDTTRTRRAAGPLHSAAVAELRARSRACGSSPPASGTRWSERSRRSSSGSGSPSLEEAGCVGPETGWAPRPLAAARGRPAGGRVPALREGATARASSSSTSAGPTPRSRAGIDYYPKLLVGVPFTPVDRRAAPDRARSDRARRWLAQLAEALRRAVPRQRALQRARQLLPRRRARGPQARRLPAAPRLPVPLEQRRLRELRGLPRPRCAASAATRCGASAASSPSRASRIERARGRRDPRRAVRPDVPRST